MEFVDKLWNVERHLAEEDFFPRVLEEGENPVPRPSGTIPKWVKGLLPTSRPGTAENPRMQWKVRIDPIPKNDDSIRFLGQWRRSHAVLRSDFIPQFHPHQM